MTAFYFLVLFGYRVGMTAIPQPDLATCQQRGTDAVRQIEAQRFGGGVNFICIQGLTP